VDLAAADQELELELKQGRRQIKAELGRLLIMVTLAEAVLPLVHVQAAAALELQAATEAARLAALVATELLFIHLGDLQLVRVKMYRELIITQAGAAEMELALADRAVMVAVRKAEHQTEQLTRAAAAGTVTATAVLE
jgi:hypothetical protein